MNEWTRVLASDNSATVMASGGSVVSHLLTRSLARSLGRLFVWLFARLDLENRFSEVQAWCGVHTVRSFVRSFVRLFVTVWLYSSRYTIARAVVCTVQTLFVRGT